MVSRGNREIIGGEFFEDQNFDSGTGQEKTKNMPSGLLNDAISGFYGLRWLLSVGLRTLGSLMHGG